MKRQPNNVYVRLIREQEPSVLCVGSVDKKSQQKRYFDPLANSFLAIGTGQQTKYSFINEFLYEQDLSPAPVTFIVEDKKGDGKISQQVAFTEPDPMHPEALLRGYMKTVKVMKDANGGRKKKKDDEEDEADGKTYKRRSPMSFSFYVPWNHRLAGNPQMPNSVSINRSDSAEFHNLYLNEGDRMILFDDIEDQEIRDRMVARKFDPAPKSMSVGLYTSDIVMDMDRMFSVTDNAIEQEVPDQYLQAMREAGWTEFKHSQYGTMLDMPDDEKQKLIEALAHALLNHRITSNQSANFSLMNVVAVVVSTNANEVKSAVLPVFTRDDKGKYVFSDIETEETDNTKVFVSKSVRNLLPDYAGECSIGAVSNAEAFIADHLRNYCIANHPKNK